MKNKNKIVVTICCILIFFIYRFSSGSTFFVVNNISSYFLYPFLRAQHAIIEPIHQWLSERSSMTDLKQNIAFLEQEQDELRARIIMLQGVQNYVYETTDVRKFSKRYKAENGHIAQILVK